MVWNRRRLERSWFGLNDFLVVSFSFQVAHALIVDAVVLEEESLHGSESEIPERDGTGNDFSNDSIQILVFLGMEVVNIARDPATQISTVISEKT